MVVYMISGRSRFTLVNILYCVELFVVIQYSYYVCETRCSFVWFLCLFMTSLCGHMVTYLFSIGYCFNNKMRAQVRIVIFLRLYCQSRWIYDYFNASLQFLLLNIFYFSSSPIKIMTCDLFEKKS